MASLKNSCRFWCILVGLAYSGIAPSLPAAPPTAESPPTAGTYSECQIDPTTDSNFSLALFRIWLPDPMIPVKGVLAVLPGSDADGTPLANDPNWQAIAKKWNYALLGITFTTRSGTEPYYRAERGSGLALLSALNQFSIESGHSELAKVPVAVLGHSQGGQFAYHFTCWAPQRTIAFATIKGGYYDVEPGDVAKAVPGLILAGEQDTAFRKENLWRIFALNRSPPGRWCYALEPGIGHSVGRSLELIVPFFNAVIQARLDPVIGDPKTIRLQRLDSTFSVYRGTWLPSSEVGNQWIAFMRGTLPVVRPLVAILSPSPTPIASISPSSHDFGDLRDEQKSEAKVFDVQRPAEGSKWDAVRTYSVRSLFDVSVIEAGDQWRISVQPRLDKPLGRLYDTVILRFSNNGTPVLGGASLNVTFRHLHDAVSLSAYSFYAGTHSEVVRKTLRLTAISGTLRVRETRLVNGTAAILRVLRKSETSVVLEATFDPLLEKGDHSGEFAVALEEPIKTEIRIPFLGHYAPSPR